MHQLPEVVQGCGEWEALAETGLKGVAEVVEVVEVVGGPSLVTDNWDKGQGEKETAGFYLTLGLIPTVFVCLVVVLGPFPKSAALEVVLTVVEVVQTGWQREEEVRFAAYQVVPG